jgi:uncharacterized membrane protein YhaH (DUF805 family)
MDRIAGLFSFKGRTKRLNYWLIHFLCIGFILAAWFAGALLEAVLRVGLSFGAWGLVLAAFAAVFVFMATATRRLHDRNKSAWWLLLFVGVPGVGRVIAELLEERPESKAAALAIFLIVVLPLGVWAIVELGILRGTRGPNRYGEDPLEPGAPESQPIAAVS